MRVISPIAVYIHLEKGIAVVGCNLESLKYIRIPGVIFCAANPANAQLVSAAKLQVIACDGSRVVVLDSRIAILIDTAYENPFIGFRPQPIPIKVID